MNYYVKDSRFKYGSMATWLALLTPPASRTPVKEWNSLGAGQSNAWSVAGSEVEVPPAERGGPLRV
jgi:hypothetical protein